MTFPIIKLSKGRGLLADFHKLSQNLLRHRYCKSTEKIVVKMVVLLNGIDDPAEVEITIVSGSQAFSL